MSKNKKVLSIRIMLLVFISLFLIILLAIFSWLKYIYIIGIVILLICIIKIWFNNMFVSNVYKLYNVHTFGKKRRGKDLTTQMTIKKKYGSKYKKICKKNKLKTEEEKEKYFNEKPLYLTNVDYGYGGKIINLTDLKLYDLNKGKWCYRKKEKSRELEFVYYKYQNLKDREITYEDIISGSYKNMKIRKIDMFEGLDLYLSDAQLYLPNTEHNELDREFPWLPVFIALAGQLYNMLISLNTQEYNRLWVKLRGQQDAYIRALKTYPVNKSFMQKIWKYLPILNKFLFMKIRYFEEQQSAENNILPFSAKGLLNEASKGIVLSAGQATKEQFEATYGVIKDKWLMVKIKDIKYDTRIFHEYIFGYKFVEKEKNEAKHTER